MARPGNGDSHKNKKITDKFPLINASLLKILPNHPDRIGLPKNITQPPATLRHKILNIRRHIIHNPETNLILRIITDIHHQIIRRKTSSRKRLKVNFLKIPCRPHQTVIHYLRQIPPRLKISLQYRQYSYSHGAKIYSFFTSAKPQE